VNVHRLRRAIGRAFALVSLPVTAVAGAQPGQWMFDDFSDASAAGLTAGGWTLRSLPGHPGPGGARWLPSQLSLVDDAQRPGNRLLRLSASTDGSAAGTVQAQLCHQRKYLEGTYAARVRFSDKPVRGADGDPVVQAFFIISPLNHDLDPNFSELDFEYLPNGGWGSSATRLYSISWQTVQLEPWRAFNAAHERIGSLEGWRTLMTQVADGRTRHYLDGQLLAEHGGRNYPAVPMALSFSLWFSPGGMLDTQAGRRDYEIDVDWVFHAKGQRLDAAEVEQAVQSLRQAGIARLDRVPPAQPPLESLCNL
jgi:hypothetical protein